MLPGFTPIVSYPYLEAHTHRTPHKRRVCVQVPAHAELHSPWEPCHRRLPAPQAPVRPPGSSAGPGPGPGSASPGSAQGCAWRWGQRGARPGQEDATSSGTVLPREGATTSGGLPPPARATPRRQGLRRGRGVPAAPCRRRGLRGEPADARGPVPSPPPPRAAPPPPAPAGPAERSGADLDGLPVVDFHHVKIKTVNPFPGRYESAPLRVEVAADVH